MKLFVCWDTRSSHPIIGDHPCGQAYDALDEGGHEFEVERVYGWNMLGPLNLTPGRRYVQQLTGKRDVPLLELDDGSYIQGSREIIEWAEKNAVGS